MLLLLAKRYPRLKLILQDLPERVLQAKNEVWPEKCPEAIAENRVAFEPIDFFKQSPVSGCHVYYFKHVIHDWLEPEAVAILSGIRQVMAPYSRVLIHEFISRPASRVPDAEALYEQAPEPLLPNYGGGTAKQYNADIQVMVFLNGKQRTLSEFITLGEKAGLKFERLWDVGEMGLVEYRLPDGS
ncbi:hypothetical protein CVT24_007415 [Panaeolus cyanescens]|uniref:O-methyltransferase C-terminal domain-containing protein n=1 Tax=Panaeolus cyanescens TaxID=181874 RepID=A0A409YM83_9AGAR|nr:hypothetical protein CVT24_007415 [Panaeolus cyanescens]